MPSRMPRPTLAFLLFAGVVGCAGVPAGAQEPVEQEEEKAAAEQSSESDQAGSGETSDDEASSDRQSRRAQRREQRRAKATAEEGEETVEAAEDDDSEAQSEDEPDSDSDADSDSDKPARLIFTTDAACQIYVDGLSEGTLEPGDELEVGVELGEVAIRAVSTRVLQAIWEKEIELDEPGESEYRVRMARAVRQFRKEERKEGIFRDPKSELMWPRRDSARDLDWREADEYCSELETGGFESWRMPTLDELESLEAVWAVSGYKIRGSIVLTECCTWSSDLESESRAWTYNFRFRKSFATNVGYELGLRALCVSELIEPPEEDEDAQDVVETDGS